MSNKPSIRLPRVGMRIGKTLISCLAVSLVYQFLLDGRNPCFACIGAVYGLGNGFKEGFRNGFNRFVGTVIGGLMVIPFYQLYTTCPFGLPSGVYLIIGLFLVMYINLAIGANNAIQPATVVYFVVMFTQPATGFVWYTIDRIIDTGIGVLFSLVLSIIYPSALDKQGVHLSEALPDWQKSNQRAPAPAPAPTEEKSGTP